MEARADLATGHARTANARTRMRKGWEDIARVLNSDGSGCVKDWKLWAKYWKDKKSSVKRKANVAETARQRTGGGVDADVAELSETERRILTIAGGLTFATGDRHLAINPFPEQENMAPLPAGSDHTSSVQSQSILLQEIPGSQSHTDVIAIAVDENPRWNETAAAVIGEGSVCERLESPLPPTVPTPDEEAVFVEFHPSVQDINETVTLSESNRDLETDVHNSTVSPARSSDRGARRRILVATPSPRRRLLQTSRRQRGPDVSPQLGRSVHVSPHGSRRGGVSTARRRPLRRSPPSQRRSEMASLTERFIAIEEQRVDTERAIARSLEMFAEGHRIMAETMDRFSNTIGKIAQKFMESNQ